jgi:NifU-like protein involved in Fe-S cluster formation
MGELDPPAVTCLVSNPACGDSMQLSVRLSEGRIADAAFKCRGCAASIAAGSALTELIIGRTLEDLRNFSADEVDAALGGLPAESRHAAVLCADAVKAFRHAVK